MKKFLITVLFLILTMNVCVNAQCDKGLNQIYEEQYRSLEIEKLNDQIPKQALDSMENIGIKNASWEQLSNLSFENILKEISKTFSEKISIPLSSMIPMLGIILLSTIIMNLKTSFGNKNIEKIMSSVSVLCLCSSMINPMVNCINGCSLAIKSACRFILYETPIIAAIMAISGNPISATSSQTLIIAMGQIISYLSGNFLVPFMNILLGISLVSSISPGINLNELCSAIYKTSKSLFKFAASTFTGILTVQNIVSSSADNLKTEAAKFTIDSCIPIIGGAVSDAFGTVQQCLKLLKSGAGAFGMIAIGAIFLPIVIECFIWMIFLNIGQGISDIFNLKKICFLFKSIHSVMSVMFAALIFVMIIMLVSTVLLIVVGR